MTAFNVIKINTFQRSEMGKNNCHKTDVCYPKIIIYGLTQIG